MKNIFIAAVGTFAMVISGSSQTHAKDLDLSKAHIGLCRTAKSGPQVGLEVSKGELTVVDISLSGSGEKTEKLTQTEITKAGNVGDDLETIVHYPVYHLDSASYKLDLFFVAEKYPTRDLEQNELEFTLTEKQSGQSALGYCWVLDKE